MTDTNTHTGNLVQHDTEHIVEDRDRNDLVDPDPFIFGLAVMQMLIGGAAFLEARRQTNLVRTQMNNFSTRERNRFRTKFFSAHRALIRAHEVTNEFESHMIENGFEDYPFQYGERRLYIDRSKAIELRGFVSKTNSVATTMAVSLDQLSDFLGPEHQRIIDRIHQKMRDMQRQHSYDALVVIAKDAVEFYAELLDNVNSEENFMEGSIARDIRSGRSRF